MEVTQQCPNILHTIHHNFLSFQLLFTTCIPEVKPKGLIEL